MTRRLRVALLCLEWPNKQHSGGVAHYAYRVAAAIAPHVALTIVTLEGATPLAGATMVHLPRSTSRLDRYYRLPWRVRSVLNQIDADVIHSFGDDWALARSHAPLVRTFLGSSLAEARSSQGLRKLNHYLLAMTELISVRRAQVRIAIGPDSYAQFHCHRLMPPVVQVLQAETSGKSDEPSVIFIGSFRGRKRGYLVEKVVETASAELGRPVRLTVIGPATDQSSWAPGTQHISGATDQEVANLIAHSWVLMAPSLYEGFGIPVFEAMSLGVPVVVSSNPGSRYLRDAVDYASTSLGATELSEKYGPVAMVVDDEGLLPVLMHHLRYGPSIPASQVAVLDFAVQRLLSDAAPDRLVNEVYEKLAGADQER